MVLIVVPEAEIVVFIGQKKGVKSRIIKYVNQLVVDFNKKA